MKHLAVIPARSGSKGLRDKNVKVLNDKPMMAYTIEAALKAGVFDVVHVSTDSQDYAQIARTYGADVPFLRDKALATDGAGTWDAVKWTLESYARAGEEFCLVTLLQPTSPLRTADDIRAAQRIFGEKDADAVVSVCEMEHSPLWSNTLPGDGNMDGFLKDARGQRRQGLSTYYRINGAVYMLKVSLLQEEPMNLYGKNTYAYIMPKERSVDIDDEYDFAVAEAILTRYHSWTSGTIQ